MNLLRPLRSWIAALLFIASPAVGGQAILVLHPCAAELPPAAQVAMGEMAGMVGMGGQSPAAAHGQHAPDAHPACHCIGCCAAPAMVLPPSITVAVVDVALPRRAAWPLIESPDHLHTLTDRLPEKTAPPLA